MYRKDCLIRTKHTPRFFPELGDRSNSHDNDFNIGSQWGVSREFAQIRRTVRIISVRINQYLLYIPILFL